MARTVKNPYREPAIFLCIDLKQSVDRQGWHYIVDVHRPGTDGLFSKSWTNAGGRLTVTQAADLGAYVERTVKDALIRWNGVQEVPST